MDKLTILKRARDILAKQEALGKGSFYRRMELPSGKMTRSGCACAVGAIGLATTPHGPKNASACGHDDHEGWRQAVTSLAMAVDVHVGSRYLNDILIEVFTVNDSSTKEEIVAAFDRAIEAST